MVVWNGKEKIAAPVGDNGRMEDMQAFYPAKAAAQVRAVDSCTVVQLYRTSIKTGKSHVQY